MISRWWKRTLELLRVLFHHRDLERIGHDISVVEKDPEQLKRLDAFDDYTIHGTALVGDPTDPDTLRGGGVENCDAVAAVTEEDSVNLMYSFRS